MEKKEKMNSESTANKATGKVTHYVGIGASAGGLEAIEDFFSNMPVESGLAFIVIQHLSPDYKSLMVELLSKKTSIPVHRSTDGMEVMPNNIYMIPPKKNLSIFHGKLVLKEKDATRGINLPIDIFLKSLAEDQGDRAIAIILSGTGSDGTRGVRAIKESGGMVMVQDESSAKFDGMPRAAISTGVADFILPPKEMPDQLMAYMGHPYVSGRKQTKSFLSDEKGLTRIFSELREKAKVDFTYYKPTTISRRIERRMTVNQINHLNDYVQYIQRYPSEVMTLYRELLIGVTCFFRDPEAMNELMETALPALISSVRDRELRIWVTACSTGEEAYTIAILAKETMEKLGVTRDVKIFATDLDRDAVMHAGNGVYPESIAADLTPRLLGKYFYKKEENYQIARHIREMVVFAQHNLVKDPPFTKIDLITCRNLLIYLQPVLQQKALNMFNFSLNPGGILFLGTSETVGDMATCFETIHPKFKIYKSIGKHPAKCHDGDMAPRDRTDYSRSFPFSFRDRKPSYNRPDETRMMERYMGVIEKHFILLSVIVNEQMEVIHIFGDTEGFFKVPSGKVVYDITKMVIKDLAIPLATGIQKVFRSKEELLYSNIIFTVRDRTKNITLRIIPFPEKKGNDSLVAVFFEETSGEKTYSSRDRDGTLVQTYDIKEDVQQRIRDLELDLQFSKENLQATIEELETSNEELQATNEELLASNEELQSTNEELQSTNEELFTVNSEYQNKIIELTEMSNDVENLLSSSGIDILILDENCEIRKYSPHITKIFNIMEKDIGRPIHHLSHRMVDFDPFEAVKGVQINNRMISVKKKDQDGRTYLIQILPYNIGPDTYAGTMITFVDITEMMNIRQDLRYSRQASKDIVRHMPSGLFIYKLNEDGDLVLESSNPTAEKLTGIEIKQWKGETFQKIWPRAEEMGLLDEFLDVMKTGKPCFKDELHYKDDGNDGYYRLVAFLLPDNRLGVSFEDNTYNKQMAWSLEASELKYNKLFEKITQGVVYQNAKGEIISANPAAEEILGLTLDQITGKTSMDPQWRAIQKDGSDLPGTQHPSMVTLKTGKPVKNFIMGIYNPKEKTHRWIKVDAFPEFRDGESEPCQAFTIIEDITEKKKFTDRDANKNCEHLEPV
ncbi:MCP methyltransferase/methylesterase CheR/CheB with PAS/PAC sensor [Desulfamplus magnetovallimortis]|uniref:MCP methyltransferase/methylesterase CheR/CheB with PAS/PAC sensor n=1 Tax=Desulfamplus magnetovallimortis TaxID=1246637 RepID=A0A1W1H6V4_9BACT|nr:chemotaxis protein CheB [Desulfamplus magnetovallimortis]SLM28174.1 MCP methyltransferase/methylesterase CheR/CheB with PAS/PAC sensor [Desulfamplus magnetovallimortis]